VKHLGPEHVEMMNTLTRECGVTLAEAQLLALLEYLDRVIEVNRSLNLTRISSPDEAVRLHLVDSLLSVPEVNVSPEGELLDIGTGGGFPGAALCIATGRRGVLLDSVQKKSRVVNSILDDMGLSPGIIAVSQRAEDHATSHGGSYAIVTARAVAELPALVELAAPLLRAEGRLIALKGTPDESELLRGRRVAALVGMKEISVRRVEIPGGGERRCLVTYERVGLSATRLPRRVGSAQNSPLA
jgi:16S rRNA (guanine527-N7)-methyltransferase